ncbi:GNAT family N-acetyltransferase [Nocardioides sp. AX2bis]|uniref:GNAT family N-acetyltransferase n=1 Tax=Nocardioides sp. AX2bis TaxID=2653157 RepID=UPI0012EEE684|nr:GNAT family N-acetyltransferase [Nocardioides sp. AX2bis]VXB13739.1 Predicted acetyltransferase, GNAT family [Nocardioides sp. AX2bis]
MTLADDLLAVYDDRLRGEAEVASAGWSAPLGPLWLARYGQHGLVTYRTLDGLSAGALDALVADVVARWAADPEVTAWEWKTRGHDGPADLTDRLRSAGLVPEERETIMLGEAAALAVEVDLPDGVVVRRADVGPDRESWISRAAALQRQVFGQGPSDAEVLARFDRNEGRAGLWVAAVGEEVVSAGRLEVVPGTGCAGLWGGCTHPDWRGRGVYRALVAARAAWCLTQDVTYLHSDCSPMSRPILERAGLVAVTTSTPWVGPGGAVTSPGE